MIIEQLPQLTSRPGAGGEGDAIRGINRRTKRRLIGARLMGPYGLEADLFTEAWNDLMGRDDDVCECVRRWAKEALWFIEQRRRERRERWERATAKRWNVHSYFAVRDLQARAAGWSSYRTMRTERGWAG